VQRLEEGPHTVGILVDQLCSPDQRVDDERRILRDVLEMRHGNR
jgi:hypothetical protein